MGGGIMRQRRFWKFRCVIAWIFRVIGIVIGFIVMAKLSLVFESGFAVASAAFTAFACLEGLGRFFSWTRPFEPLPRFYD